MKKKADLKCIIASNRQKKERKREILLNINYQSKRKKK